MSIDTTHAQYDAYADQWQTMRDFSAGEQAVKEAGTRYLPMLGGQRNSPDGKQRYAAYKLRAAYYNATGRTVDGLTGMVFAKAPGLDLPDGMDHFLADVTLGGLGFQAFAETVVEEVITIGRCGLLVDFPRVEPGGMTREQADAMNLRPFWSLYKAESILNWRVGQIGNRTVITQVRLSECTIEQTDEFESEEIEQIRVLDLDDSGLYRQRVYRQSDNGEWHQHGDDIYPTMAGQALTSIPFVFIGPRDTTPQVCKPPLIDLANVNASHYRNSADLEHGAHATALPTPYLFGVQDENEQPFEIGPDALWTGHEANVTVGMLEFSGAGLKALEAVLERKEHQMASLGINILNKAPSRNEKAETAAIRQQRENSVLASISMAVSEALRKALVIAAEWMQVTGDIAVDLNRDFTPNVLSAQEITALMGVWQAGGMAFSDFIAAMKTGEPIQPGRTAEDIQADIETEAPATLTAGMNG